MTMNSDAAQDMPERLREELLFALEREGIDYPPERLDEALVEFAQLKRLIGVIAADGRTTETAMPQA
jgi:hypothetical protein